MPTDILTLGRIYGIDSLIEFLSLIIAGITSYYSHRLYKLIGEKEFKYFSIAFLFIAISFLFKILSNITLTHYIQVSDANFIFTIASQFEYIQLINFFSFLFYKTFILLGLLILFFIATQTKRNQKIFLFIYLSLVTILFSIYFNFIFDLTLIFLLIFLTSYFYENYQKNKSNNSFMVFIGFLLFLIGRIILIFSGIHPLIYLIGEIFILFGFIALLINLIKIKNEQKTNKIRSYKGHLRSTTRK